VYKQILINAELRIGERGQRTLNKKEVKAEWEKSMQEAKVHAGLLCHRRKRRRLRRRRSRRRREWKQFGMDSNRANYQNFQHADVCHCTKSNHRKTENLLDSGKDVRNAIRKKLLSPCFKIFVTRTHSTPTQPSKPRHPVVI
jgi:hypothetical protein